MDPQFNLTSLIIDGEIIFNDIEKNPNKKITRIFDTPKVSLTGDESDDYDIDELIYKVNENLDIIPGSISMININTSDEINYALRKLILDNKLKEKYDYIFIDCPPTKGKYLTISFFASDYYVIPVKPDFLSTIGIELFKTEIKSFNNNGFHKIKELGMIFTLVNEGINHHNNKMKEIKEQYEFTVFDFKLKHSYKIPEYAEKNKLIYDINNATLSEFKNDIIKLSREFIKRFEDIN